jgi:uncharacterized protein YqeY
MKAQQKDVVLALRTLHSDIKNCELLERKELTDDVVIAVVAKGIKQRQDALTQFRQAGREDLAVVEESQIALFRKYLPTQLDRPAVEALVREAIAAVGAAGKKDLGKVMGALMPKVKGKADGKMVNEIVNSLLA